MGYIDAHLHVFARDSAQFPREETALAPAEREETVEKFIGAMDQNDIDQAMLVQIGGAQLSQHAYLRHCLDSIRIAFWALG